MVFKGLLEVAYQFASRYRGLGHEVTFQSFSELFEGRHHYTSKRGKSKSMALVSCTADAMSARAIRSSWGCSSSRILQNRTTFLASPHTDVCVATTLTELLATSPAPGLEEG